MSKYHILYKDIEEDIYSKGQTYDSTSEIEALISFRKEKPNVFFIYLMAIDNMELLSHQIEGDKKFQISKHEANNGSPTIQKGYF